MSSTNNNNSQVAMLVDMGFPQDKAQEALQVCDGNMERAVEYLFGGGGGGDPPTSGTAVTERSSITRETSSITRETSAPVNLGNYRDVQAALSQYSFDEGRSACTCIALTAATSFLQQPASNAITGQFLQDMITKGIATYQQLQSTGGSVEHMSAEEVLGLASSVTNHPFSKLSLLPGGIRQGILSRQPHPEMGLLPLLTACRQEAPAKQWLAVLITKTPETVLACLPPSGGKECIVIDSHPRPTVVGEGAYGRILDSLEHLVAHLATILPATELGPDIPEMMAMMYNSFDLYPLILKK